MRVGTRTHVAGAIVGKNDGEPGTGRGSCQPALIDLSRAVAEPQTLRLDVLKRAQAPAVSLDYALFCVRQRVGPNPTHTASRSDEPGRDLNFGGGYGSGLRDKGLPTYPKLVRRF
jgi:hypothetical protein